MNDSGALEKIVDEVLAANAKNVEEYRAGKDKAFNALVGQIMKASKGKANPAQVNELLKARLDHSWLSLTSSASNRALTRFFGLLLFDIALLQGKAGVVGFILTLEGHGHFEQDHVYRTPSPGRAACAV